MIMSNGGLTNEFPVDCLNSQQFGERIVKGKEPIFSCGWEIGFPGCVHRDFFYSPAA
jgi:hypothetical protein